MKLLIKQCEIIDEKIFKHNVKLSYYNIDYFRMTRYEEGIDFYFGYGEVQMELDDFYKGNLYVEEIVLDGETIFKTVLEDISLEELAIENLDLPARTYHALKRAGLNTIEEVISHTEKELIKIRNMGNESIKELKEKLSEKGLALKSC